MQKFKIYVNGGFASMAHSLFERDKFIRAAQNDPITRIVGEVACDPLPVNLAKYDCVRIVSDRNG